MFTSSVQQQIAFVLLKSQSGGYQTRTLPHGL